MTGEGGKENKTGSEPPQQTRGDNKAGKGDSPAKTAQTSVKSDPGNTKNALPPANTNVNTSNHVFKNHESTPDPQKNCNVSSFCSSEIF